MHTNILWRAFLIVIFAITLFYSGSALYRYYVYKSLSAVTVPKVLEWNIVKEMDARYILETAYQFVVAGKEYQGTAVWHDEIFVNEYGAQEAIEESNGKRWEVYYNPSDPEESSLQRKLPAKEGLYAMFLLGLFLYFLWLGYYAGSYKT